MRVAQRMCGGGGAIVSRLSAQAAPRYPYYIMFEVALTLDLINNVIVVININRIPHFVGEVGGNGIGWDDSFTPYAFQHSPSSRHVQNETDNEDTRHQSSGMALDHLYSII